MSIKQEVKQRLKQLFISEGYGQEMADTFAENLSVIFDIYTDVVIPRIRDIIREELTNALGKLRNNGIARGQIQIFGTVIDVEVSMVPETTTHYMEE